jgi:diaminopimelate epimerase
VGHHIRRQRSGSVDRSFVVRSRQRERRPHRAAGIASRRAPITSQHPRFDVWEIGPHRTPSPPRSTTAAACSSCRARSLFADAKATVVADYGHRVGATVDAVSAQNRLLCDQSPFVSKPSQRK